MILMISATVVSLVIAIPIGIFSAVRQYSRLDYFVTTFSFFGTAMPVFWFGLMLIILFGGNRSPLYKAFGFPYIANRKCNSRSRSSAGQPARIAECNTRLYAGYCGSCTSADHGSVPAVSAGWSRFMRTAMLEVLRQDYIRTARAKGLKERVVIMKHAMRNGLIPLITIVVFRNFPAFSAVQRSRRRSSTGPAWASFTSMPWLRMTIPWLWRSFSSARYWS